MASDKNHAKNPTSQLHSRLPLTHHERTISSENEASGNPWDAIEQKDDRWTPRPRRHGTLDWLYIPVLLGIAAAVALLALYLK